MIPIAPYSTLSAQSRNYQQETILNQLQKGDDRVDYTVIHKINKDDFGPYPTFQKNSSVPQIANNCTGSISCDIFYEPDWSYKLTTTINCNEVAKKDPCFATYACICDNNYSQIASLMPQIPIEQQTVTVTKTETPPEEED